VKQWCFLR